MSDYKPWEEYPEIWKSEAAFWTFLRGCIRRGLWERSPVKLKFKNEAVDKPPEDYTGRAKTGAYCALSGVWEGKSKLEVDHKEGHVSLKSWDDLLPFIQHMIPVKGSMQLVTKEAHKIKSYQERMGLKSFEEAKAHKEAIKICKGDDKKWLKDQGVEPANNAKKRREQIISILCQKYP